MRRSIFAVSALAFILPLPSVEGQLQAAWKLQKEGNTDNQAFISMNGHSLSLPPFLGQMFGGNNSLGDFLALFNAGGLNREAGSMHTQTTRSSIITTIAPQATNNSRNREEVEIGSGQSDNDTWIPTPQTWDDRFVPSEVDVGPDGLLYFKGYQNLNIVECKTYCHGFRGFRLAIAKTNATMKALRSYGNVTIDLTIDRNRMTGTPKFVWGDGSELDRSLLGPMEPVMDSGVTATVLIMYIQGGTANLNDVPVTYTLPCLCQGSFGTSIERVI